MEKDSGQRTSEIGERKVGRMMGRNEREAERKEREWGERERKREKDGPWGARGSRLGAAIVGETERE